jgi:flagella basal body P-ring formation protein FlgA
VRPGFVVLGVVSGMATSCSLLLWMFFRWDAYANTRPRPPDTAMIFIAARPLPAGWTLTEQDVVAVQAPLALIPPCGLIDEPLVMGRTLTVGVSGNQFLCADRLE